MEFLTSRNLTDQTGTVASVTPNAVHYTYNVNLNNPSSWKFDNTMKIYICSHPGSPMMISCFVQSLSVWFTYLYDSSLNRLAFGLSRETKLWKNYINLL